MLKITVKLLYEQVNFAHKIKILVIKLGPEIWNIFVGFYEKGILSHIKRHNFQYVDDTCQHFLINFM